MMRSFVIALVLIGLAAQGARGQARDKPAADAAFADGQRRYAAGEYLEAAEKFVTAYQLDPDPAYLFNIAQAYRLGGACAKAAKYYRDFLGAVSSAPNLAKVQQYIEQSDECAKKQAPVPIEPVVTQPVEPLPTGPVDQPTDPGRTKRYVGVAGIMVGVAGLGVGVYFNIRSNTLNNEAKTLCTTNNTCTLPELEERRARADEDGQAANRNAVIGYTVGGVALAAGITLYLLNRAPDETKPQFSIVPTADGAMATSAFRF